jgi:CHASE2 domain-containing sensor protein
MKQLMRTFATVFMFAGILVDCLAILLLVALMVRIPPLLAAVVLACWILNRLQRT